MYVGCVVIVARLFRDRSSVQEPYINSGTPFAFPWHAHSNRLEREITFNDQLPSPDLCATKSFLDIINLKKKLLFLF